MIDFTITIIMSDILILLQLLIKLLLLQKDIVDKLMFMTIIKKLSKSINQCLSIHLYLAPGL